MTIIKKQNGSELIVAVEGSIDGLTAPDLASELDKSLRDITNLVLDFEKVDYLSSAGLRVLLMARKTMSKQGNMVLRNVNKEIMDIFVMTGFDTILSFEK